MSPRPRTCGSTSTRRTAAGRACRRAIGTGSRTSTGPIRSPSTRTSGSSRRTTSAGCWSARARISGRSSAAGRPSTTAAARAPDDRTDDGHDAHADQLNFYKLSFEGTRRWRALKLWMSWKHLGTEGFGRLIEANDDLAALLASRCADSDDFEAIPRVTGALGRLLPAPAGRAARRRSPCHPATLDAHQDRLQTALEVVRRRLADDDPPAWLDLAPCRDRQLPLDRGRHRPAARDAPPPGCGGAV